MTDELKPCPFCGGEAYLGEDAIVCGDCGIRVQADLYATDDQNVESWNTRA